MKVLAAAAALLFVGSAAVQLNDPDPVRWFLVYAVAAALCAASLFVAIPAFLSLGIAAVAFVWAATLLPGVATAAAFTGSEEERELAGLVLVGAAGLALWRQRAS